MKIIAAYLKGFQNTVECGFPSWNISVRFRDIQTFLYYAN